MQLSQALIKLATSPVKADRDAISRIEKEMQKDVMKIASDLDDLGFLIHSPPFKSKRKNHYLLAIPYGVFLGSITGLIALLINCNYYFTGLSLGFACGYCFRLIVRELHE